MPLVLNVKLIAIQNILPVSVQLCNVQAVKFRCLGRKETGERLLQFCFIPHEGSCPGNGRGSTMLAQGPGRKVDVIIGGNTVGSFCFNVYCTCCKCCDYRSAVIA